MKPLVVLLASFAIALALTGYMLNRYDLALAGRIAMSTMLLFTAVGHFTFTEGMVMMLPPALPSKHLLVYVTGIIEIAAAIGMEIYRFRDLTGWLLIVFFFLLLPANIYAAVKRIDFENANFKGNGIRYLWFRIPLQFFFISWTYLVAIKHWS